jgi:hypothetical protein
MKSFHCLFVLSLLAASAQAALAEPAILERGPHHRVIQQVITELDAEGRSLTKSNTFTELANGMHYWSGQGWEETRPVFEEFAEAFVAQYGPHQVIVTKDLSVPVDLLTPDGKRFMIRPAFLALRDLSTGRQVLVAEVKKALARQSAPNTITFEDCFTDFSGSITYEYRADRFEQWISIFDQGFGQPEEYGLRPEFTVLEMWSEILEAPVPAKTTRLLPNGLPDEALDFGEMHMPEGAAFALDNAEAAIPVAKEWASVADGRIFLIESVLHAAIRPLLEKLPQQARQGGGDPKIRRLANAGNSRQDLLAQVTLPAKGAPRSGFAVRNARFVIPKQEAKTQQILTAQSAIRNPQSAIRSTPHVPRNAVLIDYTILSGNKTNWTFSGNGTFYLSGPCTMNGTAVVFEAGCVLKFSPTNSAKLTLSCSNVTWQGRAFAPVVLTARDDHSIGEKIGTNALSGYYADTALALDGNSSGALTLQNLRITRAKTAITLNNGSAHTISHAQFVDCQTGIKPTSAQFRLRNALFHNVLTNFNGSSATGRLEHLTVNTANWFNHNSAIALYVTNSLLVAVTNYGTFSGQSNYSNSNPSTVFQTIGSAQNYLLDNTYRNLGATNVSILADLRKMTTYPPIVLSNHFTVNASLSPQAQRDTDTPDIGWHYWPLDYCWSGLNLTNATLTLTNGVAIGIYGTSGTYLRTGAKLYGEGTPQNLNRLGRYNAVQEQPVAWGATSTSYSLLSHTTTSGTPNPSVQLRFTELVLLGRNYSDYHLNFEKWTATRFGFSHCQFYGGAFYTEELPLGVTNCLWHRVAFELDDLGVSPARDIYNNLFWGGIVTLYSGGAETFKDNLFDQTTISQSGTVTNGYNGYISGFSRLTPNQTNDVILSATDYKSGPLGPFYYPTNGASGGLTNLVNKGSRSGAAASLYHFCTQVSLAKETNSTVDIGLHYVATDANGNPIDTDGDGVPDWQEDIDGDGVPDAAETDWQSYNSPNGLTGNPGLQVFTPLK